MELWQVRKEYRALTARVRRGGRRGGPEFDAMEAQLLEALLWCDRFETELCVLRMARRCAIARLKRTKKWVESATFMREAPQPLARKSLEGATEDLLAHLASSGHPSTPLRQVLDEVAALDRRCHETRGRLALTRSVADQHLGRLLEWDRARSAACPTAGW